MDDQQAKAVTAMANKHGLLIGEAIAIVEGTTTLQEVMRRKRERAEAEEWAKDPANHGLPLKPRWDRSLANFHWSMDGETAATFQTAYPSVDVLDVDMEDICRNLDPFAEPNRYPWGEDHFEKTHVTAYRWYVEQEVTPPFVMPLEGKVVVRGGFHRLRLARHLKADTVPILVVVSDVPAVKKILTSARP